MIHQLPGLPTGRRKTQPIDHVIEASFQQAQQMFACNSLPANGHMIGFEELALLHPIDTTKLLFFSQLRTILGRPSSPGLSMLARRIASTFNGTFLSHAPRTFEK
jgi:hypothetical protein